MWCATSGCGIGLDKNYPKVVQSFIEFYTYFTTGRIMYEMNAALPNSNVFQVSNNPVNKGTTIVYVKNSD